MSGGGGGGGGGGGVEITLSESPAAEFGYIKLLNCRGGGMLKLQSESPAECFVILYIVLRALNDYWVFVQTSQKD